MTNQVIPEAAVEAAAIAQYGNDGLAWDDGMVPDWECEDDSLQESYRASARAALEAAAPHMLAEALVEAGNDLAGDSTDTHWDKLNAGFKSDGGGSVSPRNDAYLDGLEESREFLYLRARNIRRTIT